MDAREDYVWPRATSELIMLPVTGLECVGDRLLAGEACLEVRAGGRGAERRRGGAVRTKRGAGGVARAGGWGKPLWRGWGPEVSRGRPCPGACGEPAPAGSPATAAGAVPRGFRGTALAAGPEGAAAFLRGWWPHAWKPAGLSCSARPWGKRAGVAEARRVGHLRQGGHPWEPGEAGRARQFRA